MRYTYYHRGKCTSCGDIIWTNHKINGVVCKCAQASIINENLTNVDPITDEEHIAAMRATDFWWLSAETDDDTIDLIIGV